MPGSRSTSTAWEAGASTRNTSQPTHPGHVLPGADLVVEDVNPLQLEVRLAGVGAGRVDPVLVTVEEEGQTSDG